MLGIPSGRILGANKQLQRTYFSELRSLPHAAELERWEGYGRVGI